MSVFRTLFSPIGKWKENPNSEKKEESRNDVLRTIDKEEEAELNGINEIHIKSNTNVTISPTNAKNCIIRIKGITSANYHVDAYVTTIEDKLQITVKGTAKTTEKDSRPKEKGKLNGGTTEIANTTTFANVTLEIEVPTTAEIKHLKVTNSNGNVICASALRAEFIEVNNKNANIMVKSIFKKLSVDLVGGNLQVNSKAISDVELEVECDGGSVTSNLDNILNTYLQYEIEGACIIRPRYSGEFNVRGRIHVSHGSFVYS